MEERYDQVSKALAELDLAIDGWADVKGFVEDLKAYMESGMWQCDFEASESGELPEGLKCGVLSEDGLWNLLEDIERVMERANEVIKNQ